VKTLTLIINGLLLNEESNIKQSKIFLGKNITEYS